MPKIKENIEEVRAEIRRAIEKSQDLINSNTSKGQLCQRCHNITSEHLYNGLCKKCLKEVKK